MTVYFIQARDACGPVKIGYSRNVPERLRHVASVSYEPMSLIRETAGGRPQEQWFHKRFESGHIRNEWFAFQPEMLIANPPDIVHSDDAWAIKATDVLHDAAPRLIAQLGGYRAVSEALGISKVTVHRWTYPKSRGGTGGIIPHWYHAALVDAAGKRGIVLTPADFRTVAEAA